jgi:hypothetical protein
MEFNKRSKGKFKSDYKTNDLFKFYIGKIEKNSIYDQKKSIFTKVISDFNDRIYKEHIVIKAYEFRLVGRLGKISIKQFKRKLKLNDENKLVSKLSCNYKKTKELWSNNEEAKKNKKLVYHTNEHTDGYEFRCHWNKKTSNVPCNNFYQFIPVRTNKRFIAKCFNEGLKLKFYE